MPSGRWAIGAALVGYAAALVYGGVRLDDVVAAVAVAAVGVGFAVLAVSVVRSTSLLLGVALFGIAVAATVAGFAAGGALGVTAGVAGLAAAFFGFMALARSNYGIFAFALAGFLVLAVALGVHFLRADATLLGVLLLGGAAASLVLGAAMLRAGVDW